MVSYAIAELLPGVVPLASVACSRFATAARACLGGYRGWRLQQGAGERQGAEATSQQSSGDPSLLDTVHAVASAICSLGLSMGLTAAGELAAARYGSATGSESSAVAVAGGGSCGDGGGASISGGEVLPAAAG